MSVILNDAYYQPFVDKMDKSCSVLQDTLNTIRAGRANPRVLDHITVSYYGVETALNQVANIQIPEARLIMITPWDSSLLKEIEKAIQSSDLGINPNNDGKCLRLKFPALTEDRRKDLAKQVSKYGEETKVAIRNIRREAVDAVKKLEKKSEISEDDLRSAETHIQELTDKYTDKVNKLVTDKEKDLMEI